MQKNFRVAVVILNWNGKKYLEQFLPALLKTTYTYVEFYVADNHSSDQSVQMLREKFSSVKVIELSRNEGFAKGYNKALQQIDADIYVLLNQDVEVSPGWIEPVLELFSGSEKVAAVQPKILSYRNKQQFEYAGAAGGFIDWLGYAFCRGRLFYTIETDRGQYDNNCEIFWASGACMFVRSDVYRQVGGLDDTFFAHHEEIDLCWRIKNAGYTVAFCHQSVVYHVGGSSLPYGSPRKTYLNYRNNLMMMIKNYYSPFTAGVIFFRLILDGISALKLLLGGHFKDVWAIFMAHVYIYLNFKELMAKRRQVKSLISTVNQHIPPFSQLSGVYRKSVVADYFIRGKKTFSELKI
jgi:GT2 family glycosyltransferase